MARDDDKIIDGHFEAKLHDQGKINKADLTHVHTLGSIRSTRTEDAATWTPREALLETVRRIDEGEIDPDVLVVCYGYWEDDDETRCAGYLSSDRDRFAAIGVLEKVKASMLS